MISPRIPLAVSAHEMTRAQFLATAKALPVEPPMRWHIVIEGVWSSFSVKECSQQALLDAHEAAVSNAVMLITNPRLNESNKPAWPPREVLDQYPALAERFPELREAFPT